MEVEQVVVRLVADTSQYFASLDYAGARLLGYTAGLATGIAKHGIQMAATFEKNSVAVKTMVGDVQEGARLIEDITKLAIDTPFSSDQLVEVTKQLKSFGFQSSDIIDTLKVLGNVSSGTGTDIHRISLAFGQVKVAGKLMGTELRQFVDAGVPLIEYLGKVMGKPAESIRSMTEAGQIGFAQVVEAFNLMNAKGGQFAGLMDVISKTTIGGRWQAFRETLDVASRNFAMMAIEGIGLKDALADAADSMQELNKRGDQEGTRSFFETVRISVNAVWMVLRKISEAIGLIYREVKNWVKENQDLLKQIASAAAGMWLLYKAVGATIAAWRLLTMGIVAATAALKAFSLVTFLAHAIVMMTSLVSMIAPFAAWAVTLGIIAGLLGRMDAFKFNGSAFSQGLEALQEMKKVFQGVVDALQNGDFQSAWELVVAGFLYSWRVMSLTIKSEWTALMKGLAEGASLYVKALFTWTSPENIKKGEAAQRKMMQDQMRVADTASFYGLSEYNANELNTFQDVAAKALKEVHRLQSLLQPGSVIHLIPGEVEKTANALAAAEKERANADKMIAEVLSRSATAINALQVERDKIANLGEFATDPILQQRKREIDRLLKQTADNAFEAWYDAWLDSVFGATTGDFAKMDVPLGISAKAREVMNDLDKELLKGVTSFDHFTMQMKALREARFGNQAMQDAAGAAIGGFAMVGGVGPMKNDAYRFGLFRQFEAARKNVGDQETRLPPSALRGSTEAQNVINANLSRQTSVEEEVLSVLIANKELHQQSVIYQKAVADAMEKFSKDPKRVGLFGFDN